MSFIHMLLYCQSLEASFVDRHGNLLKYSVLRGVMIHTSNHNCTEVEVVDYN